MASEQYLLKNEFMAIIYNPSVLQQEHAMILMQQPQVKKDLPVSDMDVLYWDKEGKAFVDALSENYCYKKPHRVTNEKDEIIMPIQKEINLKDPNLKIKGIKKKNIHNLYEDNKEKNRVEVSDNQEKIK